MWIFLLTIFDKVCICLSKLNNFKVMIKFWCVFFTASIWSPSHLRWHLSHSILLSSAIFSCEKWMSTSFCTESNSSLVTEFLITGNKMFRSDLGQKRRKLHLVVHKSQQIEDFAKCCRRRMQLLRCHHRLSKLLIRKQNLHNIVQVSPAFMIPEGHFLWITLQRGNASRPHTSKRCWFYRQVDC